MNTSQAQTLALIGLSGSGKSTLARLLARRLGRPWADTDQLIVAQAGRPIPAIFAEEGEPAFRDRESAALAEALGSGPQVLATGGGIVLRPENRVLLRARAFVVWLDAPDAVLLARLRAHDEERPLLAVDAEARLTALRAARQPLYAEVAHRRVETDGLAPEAVAAMIISSYVL